MTNDRVNKGEILKTVTPVVEKAVEEANLILLEINFVKESGKWHLRVFIYNDKGPVTHDDCENITKKIEPYIDEIIPVQFYLEISSPGTERKLKTEKEYKIFKGKRVKIKLKKHVENDTKTFTGKIIDYTEDKELIIEPADKLNIIKVKKEDISSVKLEPEYNY